MPVTEADIDAYWRKLCNEEIAKLVQEKRGQMTDNNTETWVSILTGDFAGQSGTICRQRGTGAYVNIPGVGYVLCHMADLEFRPQRTAPRFLNAYTS